MRLMDAISCDRHRRRLGNAVLALLGRLQQSAQRIGNARQLHAVDCHDLVAHLQADIGQGTGCLLVLQMSQGMRRGVTHVGSGIREELDQRLLGRPGLALPQGFGGRLPYFRIGILECRDHRISQPQALHFPERLDRTPPDLDRNVGHHRRQRRSGTLRFRGIAAPGFGKLSQRLGGMGPHVRVLILESADQSLGRPLVPELRERLDHSGSHLGVGVGERRDQGRNRPGVAPIAQGLLSHKVNETVEVTLPGGKTKFKILKIEPTI